MNKIVLQTQTLNRVLSEADVLQTEVFSLPSYSKKDERLIIEQGLKKCKVKHTSGKTALAIAKDSFLNMSVFDHELSTRFTSKHLGLITVASHHQDITDLSLQINEAKNQFKAEVQTLGDERAKFDQVHKALPGLVTSMAYRNIHTLKDVNAIYFNWAKRSRSEKVDIDKLSKQLQEGTGKGAFIPIEQREKELDILQLHSSRTLRYKRPINIRPECSVRNSVNQLTGKTVGNPTIILSDSKVHFTPLKSLLNTDSANRIRNSEWKLIIPRLNLYASHT